MGPFKIIERVGPVAYGLNLPTEMDAFHNVFHVSQLRKCLTDQYVIVPELPSELGRNLTLETRPVRIVDRMEKATRKKVIPLIKVVWYCNGKEESTWETEAKMKADFPEWFKQFEEEVMLGLDSGTNPYQVGVTCSIASPILAKDCWNGTWDEGTCKPVERL